MCIKWVTCEGFRCEMSVVSFNSLPHFLHTGTCVKLQAQLMLCLLELCLQQLQAQLSHRSLPPLQKQLVSWHCVCINYIDIKCTYCTFICASMHPPTHMHTLMHTCTHMYESACNAQCILGQVYQQMHLSTMHIESSGALILGLVIISSLVAVLILVLVRRRPTVPGGSVH